MILTESDYYSQESNRDFMSVSQFKDFMKCPAMAMAKLCGEYEPEHGRALLLGSYVDEMLTGTKESQDKFIQDNRAELCKKNGELYADVAQAVETIQRVREQPVMMKYLNGEHQRIMTGEIEGVPFKIKMDSYKHGEFIADLKYMASLRSPNLFQPMIRYWGYDIQAACYQEIVRQNIGEKLPTYLACITKQAPPDLAVVEIPQEQLDAEMAVLRQKLPLFEAMRLGVIEAPRCNHCAYCRQSRTITRPLSITEFN